MGVKNYPGGQAIFVDTPGIHRPLHRMNVRMVDTAVETLTEVDVVGVVVDVSESPGAGLRYLLDLVKDTKAKAILILNKIDLVKKHKLLPIIEQLSKERDWHAIVPVSAFTGDNVSHLEEVILDALPEGEPLYPADYLTDQPEREMVAEMIREQVLRLTRDELPFSTAVLIDQFQEPTDEDQHDADLRDDSRRAGITEADRHRPRRRDDQADRDRRTPGNRNVSSESSVPGSARRRSRAVARGRQDAGQTRSQAAGEIMDSHPASPGVGKGGSRGPGGTDASGVRRAQAPRSSLYGE